jgi:mRNA-degrading endonuclease YafQ of YafQ-DinJ toxin-antitoxin module
MKIIYTSKFERGYKTLTKELKSSAKKKEKLFRENPFHSSLKTHKLSGKLYPFWSFSISYNHRIVFEFISEKLVYFHLVGDHDIYK